jgi:hypothetical protein
MTNAQSLSGPLYLTCAGQLRQLKRDGFSAEITIGHVKCHVTPQLYLSILSWAFRGPAFSLPQYMTLYYTHQLRLLPRLPIRI